MDLDVFLDRASSLLTVDSTAERLDRLHSAVDFVIDFVGSGFRVERFVSGGKPSALLYAERYADPRPDFRVLLNAHLDVVPGDPEQFRPRREGDRLYARGAQDMKITALAQAMAFREISTSLPYPLGLQLVADEEVGGHDGTGHQVQHGVRAGFVITGEFSRLNIVADSKGWAQIQLHARGHSAHGAYPWLGDNAVSKIVRTVTRIGNAYPLPMAEAWRTTVNLARIDTSNDAFNRVPDRAEAWLDIRFPAEDITLSSKTPEELLKYFQAFCEPGVTAHFKNLTMPRHVDHDHPDIAMLRQVIREVGYPAEFMYKHGSGDARFYSAQSIPAVAFGIGGNGQHGPDEYAELSTIEPYYQALTTFLRRVDHRSR